MATLGQSSTGSIMSFGQRLKEAVEIGMIPVYEDVYQSCFFIRADSVTRSYLIFFYKILFHYVSCENVDNWVRDGKLTSQLSNFAESKLAELKRVPRENMTSEQKERSAIFTWWSTKSFRGHRAFVDIRDFICEWPTEVIHATTKQGKRTARGEERAKQDCYLAFGTLKLYQRPEPLWVRDGYDVWYELGFCACGLPEDTKAKILQNAYNNVAKTFDFQTFWHAYQSRRLAQLLDKVSEVDLEPSIPDLHQFLNCPPNVPRDSVFQLAGFLSCREHGELPPDLADHFKEVVEEYGFNDLKNKEVNDCMVAVYREIFRQNGPLQLQSHRGQGQMYNYAYESLKSVEAGSMGKSGVAKVFNWLDQQVALSRTV